MGRMSKLKKRYWLETDDSFITTGKNTEQFIRGILPTVFLYTNSTIGSTTPISSILEIFTLKNTFCGIPTHMHATQYIAFFITYHEGLNLNTGNKNTIVVDEDSFFSQQQTSSPLVFDSVKAQITFIH